MSSSRTRNFRRRSEDEEENTTTTAASPIPTTTAVGTARKSSSSKPKKLLSFVEDEDEDEQSSAATSSRRSKPSSRLSKPSPSSSIASYGHKLTSSKDRIAATSSNVVPQAGTYTKEALLELQKNTRTLAVPSSRPPPPPPPVVSSAEPKIVLKGLLKPQAQEPLGVEEASDSEENRGDVEGRLGRTGTRKVGDSGIPDEETIKAIRAKRERMRKARGAAPDYIALDSGSNHGAAEGLSDEEPEFRTRIAMIGTKKKGVFEDVDDVGDETGIDIGSMKQSHDVMAGGNDVHHDVDDGDGDEDEESMWVEEQVRKGLGKRMEDGSASRAVNDNSRKVHGVQQQHQQHQQQPQSFVYARASPASIGGTFGGPQSLDGMSMSQQGEIAKKALQDNITRLKV